MDKTLTETDILKNNIKELQRQLQQSYIRIKELNEEISFLKNKSPELSSNSGPDHIQRYRT